jgi:hypothetical protein
MEHAASHPVVEGLTPAERRRVIKRLRWLSRLLDTAITIPGVKVKIGLDPILGLVPGAGDVVTTLLSGYMVYEAKRLGADRPLLTKMTVNVVLDLVVGAVPVAGDVFDFAFKANTRNWNLLREAGLVEEEGEIEAGGRPGA